MAAMGRTLFAKVWDDHVVEERPDGSVLLFIDRHLIHDATSPQAFSALRRGSHGAPAGGRPGGGRPLVPTADRGGPIADPRLAVQVAALEANAREFGIPCCRSATRPRASSMSSGRSRASCCPA